MGSTLMHGLASHAPSHKEGSGNCVHMELSQLPTQSATPTIECVED